MIRPYSTCSAASCVVMMLKLCAALSLATAAAAIAARIVYSIRVVCCGLCNSTAIHCTGASACDCCFDGVR